MPVEIRPETVNTLPLKTQGKTVKCSRHFPFLTLKDKQNSHFLEKVF